ncbi:spatacsin-like [Ascaphus truei]|uniref:spatacsin-like n=1 Tax=Ascaphus truei TaxID=8439 RepID=UPI003F5A9C32
MEDCPLLLLLDVYQLCLQHKNYTEAAERLRDFQSSLLSLQSAGVSPAASPPASWLQVRASQLLQLLILQSRTPYERRKVLQLLCDGASQWVGEALDVHKLSALAQILREQPLSISQELLSEYSAAGLRVECQRLLQILQDGGHFSLARKVAELAELPTDSLVIEEVLKDQRLLQQVGQWQSPQSRAHYWRKCHQTFSTHQLSPGAASGFFRSQAAGHLAPGPLVPEQAEGLAEKELLLTLAGHWLSLSDCAPSPALEELEQQIWECRITREVVSRRAGGMSRLYRPHPAGTVPSFSSLATLYSFSSLPALNCPLLLDISRLPPLHGAHAALDAARTQALSSLIDRLLDESRVHEASRVCKYFQLPHRDLRLALNCRALATGETARDQLHPDIQAILTEGREAQESVWNRRKRLQRSSSQERAPPGGGSPQPMDPLLRDLEILKDECIHGKIFCRQLLCVYELSQDLGCSFSDVSSRDAGEILRSLLSCRRPPPDLSDRAQAVISSHGIPPHTVAQIVAEEGLRSWRVLGEERGQAHVYNASEIRRSFLQLAKLCPDPTLVGLKLLDNLGSVPLTQPHCSEY